MTAATFPGPIVATEADLMDAEAVFEDAQRRWDAACAASSASWLEFCAAHQALVDAGPMYFDGPDLSAHRSAAAAYSAANAACHACYAEFSAAGAALGEARARRDQVASWHRAALRWQP